MRLPLLLLTLFVFSGCKQEKKEEKVSLSGKKILMVIAFQNFRDEEFKEPYELFKKLGAEVTVASSKKGEAKGMLGMTFQVENLLSEQSADPYDAIIFVGGMGSTEYWDNPDAHKLLLNANTKGKVIGAICLAPVTLAKAGVLRGKKATVYPTDETLRLFRENEVSYTQADVVVDGKIVTASGPQAAKKFGEKIVEFLTK